MLTQTITKSTSNIRWGIASMLCLSAALNYMDRQALSVLATTIQAELGLTDIDYAFITSSFLISYTIMYAISGRLTDIIGTKKALLFSVGGWSIANMLHAVARTAMQFSVFRFFLGFAESANFPAGIKAVTEWFPVKERALAVGIFNAGASIGAAVAVPLVSFIAVAWGWQSAFVVTGALGLVWVVFWRKYYHLPKDHPTISTEERNLIESDDSKDITRKETFSLKKLLTMRQAWGCFAARILIDPVTYFLIFWIPKYLQQEQGLSLDRLGFFAWIPYVALAIGTISGGMIPGFLMKKGWSLDKARKTVMLSSSVLIPIFYFLLFLSPNPLLAIVAIAGLMFGHGTWSNITIPTEVFPKTVQGTITGVGGTLGGLAGIGSQLAIGWTVQNVSYTPIFIAAGLAYMTAFILVKLLIGKLGVIIAPAKN
ncbi:MAG TPA: MFS transporter [Flavisolibacter sp.]|jgi:ACS family hexuronate transporter-like MFS transporter|nr:MFS transporter [Flavisolibacter sp.]